MALYRPIEQLRHGDADATAVEYVPGAHATHAGEDVRPAMVEKVPGKHAVQLEAAMAPRPVKYVPVSHLHKAVIRAMRHYQIRAR